MFNFFRRSAVTLADAKFKRLAQVVNAHVDQTSARVAPADAAHVCAQRNFPYPNENVFLATGQRRMGLGLLQHGWAIYVTRNPDVIARAFGMGLHVQDSGVQVLPLGDWQNVRFVSLADLHEHPPGDGMEDVLTLMRAVRDGAAESEHYLHDVVNNERQQQVDAMVQSRYPLSPEDQTRYQRMADEFADIMGRGDRS
ncbi:hypothetical protein [Burkholderia gladioli]|uniref:hypothetical protein n=1 Tax=Burkholderia gladioli TaxID=28095 RepID=UPI000CFF0D85|nr:hypothetical protein [Burkholderia gladioli]